MILAFLIYELDVCWLYFPKDENAASQLCCVFCACWLVGMVDGRKVLKVRDKARGQHVHLIFASLRKW